MRGDVHSPRRTNPEFCGPGRARLCDKQKLQVGFRGALFFRLFLLGKQKKWTRVWGETPILNTLSFLMMYR